MSQTAASIERQKVGMFAAPPVVFLGICKAAMVAHLLYFGGFSVSAMRAAFGLALMLAAVCLIAACVTRFQKAGTPVRPVAPATAIVSDGPYRFSRNPMYVGMAGLLTGVGILLGSYAFVAGAALFVAIVHVGVVLPEERYLEALHGEAYRRYRQAVRRWL